jgi:hypothetical protein
LEDRRVADRLGQVALPGARRCEEKDVLALGDEAGGREVVHQGAVYLLVEIEIKGVERALGIAKARELVAALEQAVLPPTEFVSDESRNEIDRRHFLSLRSSQARV